MLRTGGGQIEAADEGADAVADALAAAELGFNRLGEDPAGSDLEFHTRLELVPATLAKGLAAADLVDRYHLLVFPVLLGAGRRLFDDSTDTFRTLELVEHEAYANGVLKSVYDVVR